jgi:hypothetical protein
MNDATPSRYSRHFTMQAWDSLAWEVFGVEYADLHASERGAVLRDIDGMMADEDPENPYARMVEYRNDIGRGNLPVYARCLLATPVRILPEVAR